MLSPEAAARLAREQPGRGGREPDPWRDRCAVNEETLPSWVATTSAGIVAGLEAVVDRELTLADPGRLAVLLALLELVRSDLYRVEDIMGGATTDEGVRT